MHATANEMHIQEEQEVMLSVAHKQVTETTSKSKRGNAMVHARRVTKQPIPTHATLRKVANAIQVVWRKTSTQPHTHKPR